MFCVVSVFVKGAFVLERSRFERLRAFLHKKPVGERITDHRVFLTFLWLLLSTGYFLITAHLDYRSEAMQVAECQAQAIVGGLLQATGEVQKATVDEPMFRARKCTVHVIVPFDRGTTDADKVLGFYDNKLRADGWSLVKIPRNAERVADNIGKLYQRGDRESVSASLGADRGSVLLVVVVNAFSYEFFWNLFFTGYLFFCCLLMLAVIWGWNLHEYLH